MSQAYPDGCSDTQLAIISGVYRGTIKKIRSGDKPVTYSRLDAVFSSLDLDLEECDYKNSEETSKSIKPKNPQVSLPDAFGNQPVEKLETIKGALLKLNYSVQEPLFQDAVTQLKPAGAFLIHGKPDYGQRWLVNRLTYQVPYHTNAWRQSIYLKPHRKNIQYLWEDLARKVNSDPSPQAIAEGLYQYWQTQTVILALHDVDLIAGGGLQQFLEQLWQPLVKLVKAAPTPEYSYRLLLFLVDNKNSKCKWNQKIPLATQLNPSQAQILDLQELEPFNQEMIKTWAGVQSSIFSTLWTGSESLEQVMGEIVLRDNQPISVLRDICQCFELDWYMDIEAKLAL
ncbi:MAG: hypothetical protein F6K47_27285 [Symploca sp. SIO2E6]|nr:hypothetical protein [Symploca sp. SIO2E6]